MVSIGDARDLLLKDSSAPVSPRFDVYVLGPSLMEVLAGAELQRGHTGDAVRALQERLNALGASPPLDVDGLFGPLTEAALFGFNRGQGLDPFTKLTSDLWLLIDMVLQGRRDEWPGGQLSGRSPNAAPLAPRFGEKAPAGTMSAGQLARLDDSRMRARSPISPGATNGAPAAPVNGGTPVVPANGQTRADAELERLQQSTIASAQRELAAGVHEDLGDNRGRRIDEYARDSRMGTGYEWCGFFTGFNYNQAARESGGRFTENIRFHSMQKARAYFEYRNYTNNSRAENDRLDRLRTQHEGEGSTRRWMVLNGSAGQRHAQQNQRPFEAYEPNNLPIRAGDTALFSRGHVGLVESYDPASGRLTTVEGNAGGGRVRRKEYNLNDAEDRARFKGFGRPARGDFDIPGSPVAQGSTSQGSTSQGSTSQGSTSQGSTLPSPAQVDPMTGATIDAPASSSTPANGSAVRPTAGELNLPPRDPNMMTGSQFMERTRNMSRTERELFIRSEIERGNVPDFARQMKEIEITRNGHTAKVRVMPDYLAIGSNEDFVRIPMDANTAQVIADRTGTVLPTRRIVDEVYRQADVRLTPRPMQAGPQMMSNDYYARHNATIESQGPVHGALTAGHKKDLVITNLLDRSPDRVAIYGWHQQNGRPIQPLSTIHEETYADYSHGVRLVGGTVNIDGVERPIAEVLADPQLAPLLSDEGVIRNPRANR